MGIQMDKNLDQIPTDFWHVGGELREKMGSGKNNLFNILAYIKAH